jgi:hypothetical protein
LLLYLKSKSVELGLASVIYVSIAELGYNFESFEKIFECEHCRNDFRHAASAPSTGRITAGQMCRKSDSFSPGLLPELGSLEYDLLKKVKWDDNLFVLELKIVLDTP